MPLPGHSVCSRAFRPAETEAVLDVVRAAHAVEEGTRVDVRRVLRTEIEALAKRSEGRAADEIAARAEAHAALGRENEASVVVRVLPRHEHVRADDVIVGELPESVRPAAGVGVALVQQSPLARC